VKNDLEAKVLCLTAIGLIKLNHGQLDAVKVVLQKYPALTDHASTNQSVDIVACGLQTHKLADSQTYSLTDYRLINSRKRIDGSLPT